ncbi:helix-turn-helix domain-containing protein [Anaerosalibacter sp. Marseille-P3206]|uniref:helix-turn-helix domain-containing protein n=1 Tax=Anaerosalibacter sp. Marseille-P3206 TaxID=1871005 RepID=UPI000985D45A|nr:helix-turn-helix domain-containing protein [Anaerosalibacter sp. Marseille-P3206]
MKNHAKLTGVLEKGYGLAPKLIMLDKDLSIESKAIYCYISSFCGNGTSAFPSVETITHHLGIGKKRFYKHVKPLEDKGYITIIPRRNGNRRDSNLYKLNMELDFECSQNEHIQNEPIQIEHVQNDPSNNNSLNNNNINNNSSNKNNYNNNSSNCEEDIDKEFKELAQLYQKCGFKVNGLTPSWINSIKEEYGFQWCKNAFLVAEKKGKLTKSYVEGILQNWNKDGGMKLGGGPDGTNSRNNESSLGQYADIGITI